MVFVFIRYGFGVVVGVLGGRFGVDKITVCLFWCAIYRQTLDVVVVHLFKVAYTFAEYFR